MTVPQREPYYTRRTYRTIGAVFGLLLIAVGCSLLLSRPAGVIQLTASLVISFVGANLILNAIKLRLTGSACSWGGSRGAWPV
jgi:hypothetical protein